MLAIVFERNCGPEVLEAKEAPDPQPGEGEVLVDVEAVGVKYRDVYERMGTQLAKLRGGHVIATTSTPEKAQLARGAGADEVIGYEDFAAQVRSLTGGAGVAAVYDGVGQTTFSEGLKALAPTGRMILYGAASGQPDPLPVQSL